MAFSDGLGFQSILSPGFQTIGADMPGMPLPPSSLLSIEPISMRVPDACRFTGISRSTLYLLIARGEIEVVKMGASTLVLTESLRTLIERHRSGGVRPTALSILAERDRETQNLVHNAQ
ncbi:helix-turn-helix domain-containing protein [Blastomonas fulva]|uniref:helix-turn-helix domain-containing protein n=1 Tax=Blastomonas fulva TaxID=1550728 RepID=UPI003F71F909